MAIDDLLDEHEQSEKVRTWLHDNGAGLIGGIVLGLALIGGWQWWQKQRTQQRIQASVHYQAALKDIQASKLKQAQPQIAALPDGIYATLAQLSLARAQLDASQRDTAIATLRAAKPHNAELAGIVSQRLARLLIDAGKADQALALLPANTIDPEILQVRGDAHTALNQREQARAAYTQALTRLEVGAPQRRVVELKLSEVGGTPAKPEVHS